MRRILSVDDIMDLTDDGGFGLFRLGHHPVGLGHQCRSSFLVLERTGIYFHIQPGTHHGCPGGQCSHSGVRDAVGIALLCHQPTEGEDFHRRFHRFQRHLGGKECCLLDGL